MVLDKGKGIKSISDVIRVEVMVLDKEKGIKSISDVIKDGGNGIG